MLRVYELEGKGPPRDLPVEGLEGIWPEPPFYYVFYRKKGWRPANCIIEVDLAVVQWLKSHPDWRLTSRYDLPYEKWQDISVPQARVGSFDIRLDAGGGVCGAAWPPAGVAGPGCAAHSRSRAFAGPSGFPGPGNSGLGSHRMIIDPGVVFGSGLHPTTQGCLLAISQLFGSVKIRTAVDFGAGTGILAIACALAGAKFVLAVDRNPLALNNTRLNARTNGVEERIALVEADTPGCLGICPDFFVMNLEWPILEKSLKAGEWRSARRVVLAGFLESRLESVARLVRCEFRIDNVISREGWPTVILSRT